MREKREVIFVEFPRGPLKEPSAYVDYILGSLSEKSGENPVTITFLWKNETHPWDKEINSHIRKIEERSSFSREWKFRREMKIFQTGPIEIEEEDATTGEKKERTVIRDFFELSAIPKGKMGLIRRIIRRK